MTSKSRLAKRKRASGRAGSGAESDFIDFETLGEPWNKFQLSDGSRLKLKFALLKMRSIQLEPIESKRAASFVSQVLTVIESPKKFRGPPGPPLSPNEVNSHIQEEVSFQPLITGPSIYRFEKDHTIVVNVAPTRVFRTDAIGPDGERIYQVETMAQVAVVGGMIPSLSAQIASPQPPLAGT